MPSVPLEKPTQLSAKKEILLQFTVLLLKCKKQCSPKRLNWFWVSCKIMDILTSVHD